MADFHGWVNFESRRVHVNSALSFIREAFAVSHKWSSVDDILLLFIADRFFSSFSFSVAHLFQKNWFYLKQIKMTFRFVHGEI